MTPRRAALRRGPGGERRLGALPCLLAVALLGGFAPSPRAQERGLAPIPPYRGYVTDEAGVIGEPRRGQLEGFLDQVQRRTGVQFAVLTVTTCAPEEPSAYKTRVFQAWGIGDPQRDDGLLLLVSMEEHALEFETGYGIEGTLPDGWQAKMLRDLAVPRFRGGDPAEGIIAAVLATAQRIAHEKNVRLEWNGRELRYTGSGGRIPWPVMLALFVVFFVLFPALATRRFRRRSWYSPGGWGGGFGGFGGGFGGGGSGGSSFGGFGGGSSGGGGGGARW